MKQPLNVSGNWFKSEFRMGMLCVCGLGLSAWFVRCIQDAEVQQYWAISVSLNVYLFVFPEAMFLLSHCDGKLQPGEHCAWTMFPSGKK
jgi:hypothetical protein